MGVSLDDLMNIVIASVTASVIESGADRVTDIVPDTVKTIANNGHCTFKQYYFIICYRRQPLFWALKQHLSAPRSLAGDTQDGIT
jgi:hypothetical protein